MFSMKESIKTLPFFVLTTFACYLFYRILKELSRFYKKFRCVEKIPGPKIESLIFGHSSEVFCELKDRVALISKRCKEYDGIFRVWRGWQPIVTISKAEYAEIYFTSKNLDHKSVSSIKSIQDWLGQSLLLINGQEWQQRRKLLTPAFHFSILNSMSEKLVHKGNKLVETIKKLPEDSPINVYDIMYLVALDGICESAMGIEINALEDSKLDYIKAIEDISNLAVKRTLQPWAQSDLYFRTPQGRRYKEVLKTICDLTDTAIQNKKQERTRKGINDNHERNGELSAGKKKIAFLDLLLDAQESKEAKISDKILRDEVNTFLFAGHETVASSTSFTIHLLGKHPEIQERCYQELEDIFQGSCREPTMDDLRSMKYLEQVIKESLRLFPSAPIISRKVLADTQFESCVVPEGSTVTIPIYCLHRDPKYFPDPEKFDPDRFSSENAGLRHPYAYVPFAAGGRNCIGQKYAMMEEKILLSNLIRNFTMESMDKTEDLRLTFAMVLRSLNGINIKFKSRSMINRGL